MIEDPSDILGNEAKALEDQAQADARRARERDDFRWLMGHAQGRRIVWRYLASCGVFHSSFSTEALVMAKKEGRREVGLQLLDDVMTHTPLAYPKMMEEAGKAPE